MIIAFYPGAGGNRYLRMLQNSEWQLMKVAYDRRVLGQWPTNRYLLNGALNVSQPFTLTHCLNAPHIQKHFPGQDILIIIGNQQSCLRREWMLAGHDQFLTKIAVAADHAHRLEHYNSFKEPTWPQCDTVEQLDLLPSRIKKEVLEDYQQLIDPVVPSTLQRLERTMINKTNSAFETISWHREYYTKYPPDFNGCAQIVDIDQDNTEFSKTMKAELAHYQSDIFDQVWDAIYE